MSRSSGRASRKRSCAPRIAWPRCPPPRHSQEDPRRVSVAMQLDAETLERLRRSGIRIDREGQFIHEGEPVAHEGLRRALFRWLDRDDEHPGRYVLRLDARRFATLDVDDTPLVVRALRVTERDGIRLELSDGAEEPLDPATLTVDEAGILRCRVRGGRLE